MEIVRRIHFYLFWWKNFDSKENGGKKSFPWKTKASISCIPMMKMCLWWTITKKIKIIMSIHVFVIWWMNFDSMENGGKKSFSCKTKASKSWILMKKTCSCYLITKRIDIIMRIHVCLLWWMNFNSIENGGKKKLFTRNQSVNVMYPNKDNVFMVPNHKKSGDYYKNPCWSHLMKELLILRKMFKKKNFSFETKASIPYILMRGTF